jgi:hypothetical protein
MPQGEAAPAVQASRGHVLLVSPFVFSYHETISRTLRALGYEVTWWDERASNGTLYKLALRLLPRLTAMWSERHFQARLGQLDAAAISHVLVVKGEGLSRKTARRLRDALAHASMGLYLWDGVENVRGVTSILGVFDSVATFDPRDAAQRGWTYRPLFGAAGDGVPAPPAVSRFAWCFIGTLHSDRHRVLHRLRKASDDSSRSFVFGYIPGRLMWLLRHLTDWTLWLAPKGSLSTRPMAAADVRAQVAASRVVVDVEHPHQRGLTMRTIETLMAGKKLVTTNRHILDSELYEPSRVHVISRRRPSIPAAFLELPFRPIPERLRHRYSCEGWIAELLDLQQRAFSTGGATR